MMNMACSISLCLLVLVASVGIIAGASHQLKVGGEEGWREPDANNTDMYSRWARSNRLRVGDSIYFEYKNDSVLMVDKSGYYHCNTSNPTASFNDGKTVIPLDQPGVFYFISGAPGHCKNGQRLAVEVASPHPPEHPPQISPYQPPPTPVRPPLTPAFPGPSPSPLPSAAASSPAPSSPRALAVLTGVAVIIRGATASML